MREQIEKSARHLYGLVHARYVVTTRGLAKMVRLHTNGALKKRGALTAPMLPKKKLKRKEKLAQQKANKHA